MAGEILPVKAIAKDPLTGEETEVMWVKGSGGDLGTLKKNGLAALYIDRLLSLKNIYRGIEHEDEMVELFNHCIYDLDSKAPSIDTPFMAFFLSNISTICILMQQSLLLQQKMASKSHRNYSTEQLAGWNGETGI